jgi:hypothetical protein
LKAVDAEEQVVRRLSASPYLLAVADSILRNVDRATLAEFLASYLYLSSKGRANADNLMDYAVSKKLRKLMAVAASATPALLMGMVADQDFRSVVFSSISAWIRSPKSDVKRPSRG